MKPLTPALERALAKYAEMYDPDEEPMAPWTTDILRAYRALPAVTGPWYVTKDCGWWVVGPDDMLRVADEATAQRYALSLNIAEMNG